MKQISFPLYVTDFQAAKSFFESLEIANVRDVSAAGGLCANVHFRGSDLEFVLFLMTPSNEAERAVVGRQAPEGKWLLSFPVENLGEWRSRMIAKGLDVPEIRSYPWESLVAIVDPSGNSYLITEAR